MVVRRGDAPRLAGRSRHLAQQGQELPGTPARPPLRAGIVRTRECAEFQATRLGGSLGLRAATLFFLAPGVRVCLGAHADSAPSSPLRSFVLGSLRSRGSGRVHSVDPPTDGANPLPTRQVWANEEDHMRIISMQARPAQPPPHSHAGLFRSGVADLAGVA